MKKTIKILLVAILSLGSTTLFAQKFARIDMQAVIESMPEMDSVQLNFEKAAKEYEEHLEGLQVELNNKYNDYQKVQATLSESIKQLRMREMQELQERLQQYQQMAQEDLQKTEMDLMAPLQKKANETIAKICKADGIVAAFPTGVMAYMDEAAIVDITEKVKTALGAVAK